MMFGLTYPQLAIIAAIVAIGLSIIPWQKIAELKASIPEIPDNSKPATKPVDVPLEQDLASRRYIQVQNCLLDIRDLAHDCPEALVAIDEAIKATVAMVVMRSTVSESAVTFKPFNASVGDTIGTAQIVKAAPLPPRTVDVEAGQ